MEPIVFRQWSNKKYAVLASFHKVIRIATLSLAYSLVQGQPVNAQSDTVSPKLFYDLEEVEAVGEQEAELYSPLLRQLLLIKQDQLELSSSQSIADILDFYPGIDIRTRGVNGIQSDINIQGGSFDQTLVLLNGIDMSNPQTGHFSLDLPVQPAMAHQLEILKGPGSKKYGLSAYTGAINLVTRPADSLGIRMEASYGTFNTWQTSSTLNFPVGNSRNMLAGSISGSDGYTSNTDYGNANLYFHSAASNDLVDTDLMLGWNRKAFGANAFYTPLFPEQYEETGSWLAALKFASKIPALKLDGHVYWKRHNDHFLLFRNNPSVYENYHQTDALGVAAGTKISTGLGLTLIKAQYRHERIYSTTLGDPLEQPVAVKGSDDAFYSRHKGRDHLTLSTDHLFNIGKVYMSTGLLLHAGIDELAGPAIYPGVDVSYMFNDQFSIFASGNRSMRLPTFTDLYYEGPQNRGNPDLLPETALTFETGLKYVTAGIRGDLALYYRKGKGTIDWIWTDSLWQTRNLTDLDTYGGETGVTFFPSRFLNSATLFDQLRISYSYTELNKSSDSLISNYALDNLKHKLILETRLLLPWNLYVHGKISRQERNGAFLYYETPSSTPVETAYEPYWLMDINAGIRLKRITVYVNMTNVLNTSYRDIGSVVMPGRWTIAGIKFR
ncbi:MAG: TonB-dependent receptor [Bacteroidales bacterium]